MRFIATLLLCASICSIQAQTTTAHKIDSLLTYLHSFNAFNGEVMLMKGNQVVFHATYNDLSNGSNHYRIGSITKVFTALAVYKTMEANVFTWDATLDKWYPQIPHAKDITIEMLLSHRSGIFNITAWENYYATRSQSFTKQEILDIIISQKPAFKPGKDVEYSNSNFILLGYILEDIYGKPFAEIVDELVIQPAGLENTWFEYGTPDRTIRETSYIFDGANWNPDVDSAPNLPGAAGSMVSNTHDLCMLMQALFDNQIISAASRDSMMLLVNASFGHGILKAPFYNHQGWGHTGRIDEFRSYAGYFPNDSVTMAITTNGMNIDLNELMIGVLFIYFDTAYVWPYFVDFDKNTEPLTEEFCGVYKLRLFGFIPLGKLGLERASPNFMWMYDAKSGIEKSQRILVRRTNTFTWEATEIKGELTFEPDKKGNFKTIQIHQGNFNVKAKRVSSGK